MIINENSLTEILNSSDIKPMIIEFDTPKRVQLIYRKDIVKYIFEENISYVRCIKFFENSEDERMYISITFGNTGIVCTVPIDNIEELIIHDQEED